MTEMLTVFDAVLPRESLTVTVIEMVPDVFITLDVKVAELYVTPSTLVEYDRIVDPYAPVALMLTLSWDKLCTYRLPKAVVTACTASDTDTVPTVGLNSAVFGMVRVTLTVFVPTNELPLYVLHVMVHVPDVDDGI